jgi:hypothetical protein
MQVVTSENFEQFVTTGKVDPFVPPVEAGKEPAKADGEQTRGPDGKFVSSTPASDEGASKEVNKEPAAKAADDDDSSLPERARQQIGKKHRAMKEAEEFAEKQFNERRAAEQRAELAERKLAEAEAKSRPATVEVKEPKPEDFATVALYTDALVDFKLEKKSREQAVQQEKQRIADATAAADREFGKRVADTVKEHPDYADVVGALAGTAADQVHVDVLEYIKESDVGPRILYHLAKNPSELERLQKLSPRKAIADLGKLELKLEAPAKATPDTASIARTVSQAPAPITPIDASASTVVQKDPAKMNFQELRQWDKQQQAAKRR